MTTTTYQIVIEFASGWKNIHYVESASYEEAIEYAGHVLHIENYVKCSCNDSPVKMSMAPLK